MLAWRQLCDAEGSKQKHEGYTRYYGSHSVTAEESRRHIGRRGKERQGCLSTLGTKCCPAIATGCPAWWAPPDTPFFQKGVGEELQKAENRCLRTVAGAYKATPIRSLHAEVGVPPLPLHMDGRQARFLLRSAESEIDKVIGEGILKVRRFLS